MRHRFFALAAFVTFALILAIIAFRTTLPNPPTLPVTSYHTSEPTEGTRNTPYANQSVRIYIGIVFILTSKSWRKILISKFTAWYNFDRRLILREIYRRFTRSLNPVDKVDIRFILGRPSLTRTPADRIIELEQETYNDLLILDVLENMNEGKSYEYFAALGKMQPDTLGEMERSYDYAMKLDDDSFLHLPNLLEKLRPLIPRKNTWFVCHCCNFTMSC